MIFAGMDVAKEKHCAAVVQEDGEVFAEPFGFESNGADFENSLRKVKRRKFS